MFTLDYVQLLRVYVQVLICVNKSYNK